MKNETYYKIAEAARLLGVAPTAIRDWDFRNKIKVVKTKGGHRLIPMSEINRINAFRRPTVDPLPEIGVESGLNTVQTVIILAAHKSQMLVDVIGTKHNLKLEVQGKPLIENMLDSLYAQKILNVKIVVGYKRNSFEYLKKEYGSIGMQIAFIYNKDFRTMGTLSSLYHARKHVPNSIILDGTFFIKDSKIISKQFKTPGFICFDVLNYESKKCLFDLDIWGYIQSCITGGTYGKEAIGISYWDDKQGKQLVKDVTHLYESDKDLRAWAGWERLPFFENTSAYRLGVQQVERGSVIGVESELDYHNLLKYLSMDAVTKN